MRGDSAAQRYFVLRYWLTNPKFMSEQIKVLVPDEHTRALCQRTLANLAKDLGGLPTDHISIEVMQPTRPEAKYRHSIITEEIS